MEGGGLRRMQIREVRGGRRAMESGGSVVSSRESMECGEVLWNAMEDGGVSMECSWTVLECGGGSMECGGVLWRATESRGSVHGVLWRAAGCPWSVAECYGERRSVMESGGVP
jgi:hypothetical protein